MAVLRWELVGALSALLVATACGDDDSKDTTGTDAGVSKSDAATPATLPAGAVLGAQVAGKPCATPADCAGSAGKCLSEFVPGGALVPTAEALLGQSLGTLDYWKATGGYCSAECTADAACGEGSVCFGALPALGVRGECRQKCSTSADCRDGYECGTITLGAVGGDAGVGAAAGVLPNTCQPKLQAPKLAAGAVGKACTADNAATVCGGGSCANGACTGVCGTDADCGGGAKCTAIPFYGTLGFCEESCTQDSDCGAYTGETGRIGCITAQGVCGAKVFPLAAGIVGNACTDKAQCGTGECATSLGAVPMRPAPGGYCSLQNCTSDAQCGGGACISTIGSRCYKSCTANSDCRAGYECQERARMGAAAAKVCAPAAADAGVPDAG